MCVCVCVCQGFRCCVTQPRHLLRVQPVEAVLLSEVVHLHDSQELPGLGGLGFRV